LSQFGHHPIDNTKARWWFQQFIVQGKEKAMVQKLEGYDEMLNRFVEGLTPQQRLKGLTPRQRLEGLAPDEIKLEGLREGELKGKLEGKREGKREALLDQLAARFGRVPARIQARIRAADEAALKRWSVRVLTAASYVEVIDDDAEGPGGARAGSTKRTTVAHRRVAAKRV
jgi:hypothetical protein